MLVVLGLVVEYIPEIADIARTRPFPWKKVHVVIGGVLITLGVAGELYIEGRASKVETDLRSANDKLYGDIDAKAEKAGKSTIQALDTASSANALAGKAEATAGKSDALAKSASLQVAALDKEATDAGQRAVKAEQEAARLRQLVEWRSLSSGQVDVLCKALFPFAGTKIDITSLSGDAEGSEYAQEFADALGSTRCGWVVTGPGTIAMVGGRVPEGLFIKVKAETNFSAASLQRTLRLLGIAAPGEKDVNVPEGGLGLLVAARPRPLMAKQSSIPTSGNK